MDIAGETAALVALLRVGTRSARWYSKALGRSGSAQDLLDEEQGLLASLALEEAAAEVRDWEARHMNVVSMFDPRYPRRLREANCDPPLLFVAGSLQHAQERPVAVVGTRHPTSRGMRATRTIARRLVEQGHTVISGLAAGIDTEAHEATLESGGRTVAVIGNGLDHSYPRQNAALQRRIPEQGAVVSQFWPESRPARSNFPLRNALMAGLSDACVIVEASALSGTRIVARAALERRRVVVLLEDLMEQEWVRELAARPGVEVARSPADVSHVLERVSSAPAPH